MNEHVDVHLENYAVPESTLYPHVLTYLNLRFQQRITPLLGDCVPPIATITANAATLGQWTRPDLALISLWKNKYQPALQLDLYGFEVKTRQGCNVASVHEALAQNRIVHYSYLMWHIPEGDLAGDHFVRVRDHCEAFGIGLISFSQMRNADTFAVHLKARRADPGPDAVDEFIELAFNETDRLQLLRFLPTLSAHETHSDR